jgi:DNA polymerase III delta prime subunit
MADTIRASRQGLQTIDEARQLRRWNRQSVAWCDTARVSQATLKRFWRQMPIQADAFQSICEAVRVNWQEIVHQAMAVAGDDAAMPQEVDFWVGREAILNKLLHCLQGRCRLLALTGLTGTGKTALAAQLAQLLQTTFPQQQVVGFDQPDETDFVRLASYVLGTSPDAEPVAIQQLSATEVVGRVVGQLVSQPMLLILDGLETALQGDEATGWSRFKDPLWGEFLQQWLAADAPASCIILTSQEFPAELETIGGRYPDGWHCEVVQGLTPPEQMQLFARAGMETTRAENYTCLQRIGAVYEGHPLALRVIAGEMLGRPFCGNVMAYWQAYHSEIESLERLSREADFQGRDDKLAIDRYTRHLRRAVQQRIEQTFDRLQQELPRAYLLLCFGSVYRRPVAERFWLKMLAPLNLGEDKQESLLDALRDRYLVEDMIIHNDLYVRQHNLIRTVALNHLQRLRP